MIEGASGTRTSTPVRPAIIQSSTGAFARRSRRRRQPVPPEQAVAVAAVVETAIRSSAEGRALTVPLTELERLGFAR
jgi:hypothetical protein